MSSMSSKRPYLLRAINEWIVENQCTPYVIVNALADGVDVPQDFVQDGKIILNISPKAIVGLEISNLAMQFNARFRGRATDVYVPIDAVVGVYARENGQGLMFEAEDIPEPEPPSDKSQPKKVSAKPSLKIVK